MSLISVCQRSKFVSSVRMCEQCKFQWLPFLKRGLRLLVSWDYVGSNPAVVICLSLVSVLCC